MPLNGNTKQRLNGLWENLRKGIGFFCNFETKLKKNRISDEHFL